MLTYSNCLKQLNMAFARIILLQVSLLLLGKHSTKFGSMGFSLSKHQWVLAGN